MKHFFSAAAASALMAGTAFAGNLEPAPVEPALTPIASAPAYSWDGGYAGVNLGYSGDEAEHPFSVTDPSGPSLNGSLDITSSGFTGGVQAGWNFQSGGLVYGIEADYQASNVEGEASVNLTDGTNSISGEIGTKLTQFGTIRGRVGHTVSDRFLVYGTAGFAMGETKSHFSLSTPGGSDSFSKKETENGWTVGVGAEYAFTDQLSLKSEYLYTDLGEASLYSGNLGTGGPAANLDREFNFHTVRVGLNFHF